MDHQGATQATQSVDFYPWERSMPDRFARPRNPFVPFDETEIETSVTRRFAKIVDRHRCRLAVQGSDGSFTYETLNQTANRVAWAILDTGDDGGPVSGERAPTVALLFEQGAWAIAALMGVIKAGKAYVPLDSSYPRARLEYMLQDSQADTILTHGENLALANELASGEHAQRRCRVINVEKLSSDLPTQDPALELGPDAYAYLLYTSGTTGQPKGVLGTHRQVLHFSSVFINSHHISPEGRTCMVSALCFSGSLAYIFPTLLSGAALFPYDLRSEGVGRLAGWLKEERITYYGGVPTVFRHMCASMGEHETFPDLLWVRLGGDRIEKRDLELFKRHLRSDAAFRVGLGTTEVKIIAQYFMNKDSQLPGNVMPVGYAVPGVEIQLLDDEGEPVGPGEVGEIAVKSRYLSPGYWRLPDLTAAKFLPDPEESDERIYLTGDLGRMAPDRCLTHVGRKDLQVKIRGYRVETAEVEAALLDLEAVQEAAVVGREGPGGDQQLVAYVVASGQPGMSVASLRRSLTDRLPDYMVPSAFVLLDALPLNENGKVDRRALPAPGQSKPDLEEAYVAPQTPVESLIAEIWQEVLGLERVGLYDNFFDLGGHSLLAMQVVARLEKRLGLRVDPRELVFQTLGQFSAACQECLPTLQQAEPIGFVHKLWRRIKTAVLQRRDVQSEESLALPTEQPPL